MKNTINRGYSRWTLEPLDKTMCEHYKAYTRSQVRNNSMKIVIFYIIVVNVALYSTLKEKELTFFLEHKYLGTSLETLIFMMLQNISVTILFLISQRFKWVAELISVMIGLLRTARNIRFSVKQ